jgi:gluconolactonase
VRKLLVSIVYDTNEQLGFSSYGWMNGFRPEPMLPSQVYRFDPSTGQIRVVADKFVHPNGIAFTPDGATAFV